MRGRFLGVAVAMIAAIAVVPASAGPTAPSPDVPARADANNARPVMTKFGWLPVLNFYRETAGLAPLKDSAYLNRGARLHARYMAENRVIGHSESPSRPFYTREGDLAARNGNVTLTVGASERSTARDLIERWMAAPFHAAGMLDAALRHTGFGVYRDRMAGGRVSEGATLDILRGRAGAAATKVITWPAQGMQVPITSYTGGEWPDPLTSCKGYRGSTGLPIVALFPEDVRITSSSFRAGSAAIEHCVFDAHSYRNKNASDRAHARSVLASRNTVVLIPREPLRELATYTASLTTARGRTVTWSFSIGEVEPPHHAQVTGAVTSRAFQERTTFTLAWTAQDEESGVGTYDVRWRRAPLNGRLGRFTTWRANTTATSSTFQAEPGYTYCFTVRATDRAGNRSGWGPERCTTMPISAQDLDADPVWVPAMLGDHYDRWAQFNLTQGATLSSGTVKARRIALVASRSPSGGVVDVLWNGRLLKRIDLESSALRNRDQIDVAAFNRVRTGRVVIRVVSTDRPVIIEGLGVGRR